jgi:hypothetical protein
VTARFSLSRAGFVVLEVRRWQRADRGGHLHWVLKIVGSLVLSGHGGPNAATIRGRLLSPGTYRVVAYGRLGQQQSRALAAPLLVKASKLR